MMTSQLLSLNSLREECVQWGQMLFEHAQRQSKITGKPPVIAKESLIEDCTTLEEEYRNTADQYLEIVLAILGGGAIAVTAVRKPPD